MSVDDNFELAQRDSNLPGLPLVLDPAEFNNCSLPRGPLARQTEWNWSTFDTNQVVGPFR